MTKEFKNPRAIEVIQAEYQSLCTRAGDIQYKLFLFNKDLATINEELVNINQEAAAAMRAKAVAEAKANEEKKEEPKNEQPKSE